MTDGDLRALVAGNPGQATLEEYALVHAVVRSRAPCNLLVFGVGRDSGHWRTVNGDGRTVFLEDDPKWIAEARANDRGAAPGTAPDVHRVRYWTRVGLWPLIRRTPRALESRVFEPHLPDTVAGARWDVIFVDGPRGTRWHRPGRMQSIWMAGRLARASGADVCVHDCHRTVERACCDRFLGDARLVEQVGTMRHYSFG